MRKVKISVGGTPVGEAKTWAYPKGKDLGLYMIPIYTCQLEGTDDTGIAIQEQFDVLRFGVQSKDGKTAISVGLSDSQTHTIKSWVPSYRVHSANSPENGAWQVYEDFLIHDGPDNSAQVFATVGCIEIMGFQGFVKFNDLIIKLSGSSARSRAEKLIDIGRSGNISITYARASRPALKKVR